MKNTKNMKKVVKKELLTLVRKPSRKIR